MSVLLILKLSPQISWLKKCLQSLIIWIESIDGGFSQANSNDKVILCKLFSQEICINIIFPLLVQFLIYFKQYVKSENVCKDSCRINTGLLTTQISSGDR